MTTEGYKKYKRNYNEYLNDIGKKYKSWTAYENFVSSYPEFMPMMNWNPNDIAEYGRWLRYK